MEQSGQTERVARLEAQAKHLATKEELVRLERDLKSDLEKLNSKVDTGFADIKKLIGDNTHT